MRWCRKSINLFVLQMIVQIGRTANSLEGREALLRL